VTKGIPSQEEAPPPGLRLNLEQRDAVEGFKERWMEWMVKESEE
jgi:hypothetical protein